MTQYKRPESVLVVVYTGAGSVLLLKRADLPDFWQSVTGAMRWDETDPRATAARELKEETGLTVEPAALRDLQLIRRFPILAQFRHRYAPDVAENVEHAFALEVETEFIPTISPTEHTEYRWVSFEAALRKVASWTNRDALRSVGSVVREVVVLVHGWWMSGWCMMLLARWLRRAGFEVRAFSYATVRADLHENARRLHAFLATLSSGRVHLVGHSLGGMVIRALFRYYPSQRPGRIVTLGTPHNGSCVAANLARARFGRALLGNSVMDVIAQAPCTWPLPAHEIGTMSGTRSFGIGRWIARLPKPNDGTLTVAETSLAGARARLVLPVTHTGMLTSRQIAEAVIRFLRVGRFDPLPVGARQQ